LLKPSDAGLTTNTCHLGILIVPAVVDAPTSIATEAEVVLVASAKTFLAPFSNGDDGGVLISKGPGTHKFVIFECSIINPDESKGSVGEDQNSW
jgi:hypothetical protein